MPRFFIDIDDVDHAVKISSVRRYPTPPQADWKP
jgi:hypothetical protein